MSTTMIKKTRAIEREELVTADVPIRGYTLKELAALYGVSTKCLRTWLLPHQENIGEKKGRYFTTLQVRTIFRFLGEPG